MSMEITVEVATRASWNLFTMLMTAVSRETLESMEGLGLDMVLCSFGVNQFQLMKIFIIE